MENVKVEFPSGDWWEVVPRITIGMAKAVSKLQEKVANLDEAKAAMAEGKDPPPLKDEDGNDMSLEITQEMIFAGTVAWSYGPVTREVFEKQVPLEDYYEMVRRADELYGSFPLSLAGTGIKA